MAIWRTVPVENDPKIGLSNWRVFAVPSPNGEEIDHHFNGYNIYYGSGEGRVSSKIVEFDQEQMVGTTRSGRKYQLLASPGFNLDADYVFQRWLDINKVNEEDVTDVTEEYYKQ